MRVNGRASCSLTREILNEERQDLILFGGNGSPDDDEKVADAREDCHEPDRVAEDGVHE